VSLVVEDLHAAYGHVHVLNGVTFSVAAGEIVTILGRNGSGRSSTCKALMGLVVPSAGRVTLASRPLIGLPAHEIARAGLSYVPEDRQIFRNLTVAENLAIGVKPPAGSAARWNADELCDAFPQLRDRMTVKAGYLSGGEQQMLTVFRSLLGNPAAILIDEPTEGLGPKVIDALADVVAEMRRRGLAVVLLEQKLAMALRLTDRVLVMGRGEIVFAGTADAFIADTEVRQKWLEVK
jgi:branched-chain amino acid transport system ATP-binding protein